MTSRRTPAEQGRDVVKPAPRRRTSRPPAPGNGAIPPFISEIDALADRLDGLARNVLPRATLSAGAAPEVAVTELMSVVEELRVAGEELQAQNAALLEAQVELAEQTQRYRELFDFAPDGYLVTGHDGVIHEANATAAGMLGVSARRLAGKPVLLFVSPPERPRLLHLLAQLGSEPDVHEMEMELRPRGRPQFPVWVRLGDPGRDGKDGVRWLIRDVSHQRDTERLLAETLRREQETSERLRQLDSVKNAFLLAVSHDLRGPVSAIVELAAAVESAPDGSDTSRRMSSAIRANALRVQAVQANLLDLDRLAHGAVVVRPREVQLKSLVAHAVSSADVRDRKISCDIRVPSAIIDPLLAERILDNLLGNALRHTPSGTAIEINCSRWKGSLLFTVADHGPGIPAADRLTIFEPFVTVRRGRGRGDTQALGVGLHLVSHFALLHGGRAWVERAPAGGASFNVLLKESR